MPFSKPIREESLVRSHRYCCVCHEFSGRDVNVHHIIQESDGGPNTLDNAIVLCLRCHSEAGHYNSRHPLGAKYSPEELRRHRDQWWEQCANNPVFVVKPPVEDLPDLRLKAQTPAQTLITSAKRRWEYPECAVAVRMELNLRTPSDNPPRPINLNNLITIVREGTNLFLIGEAGVGKTTMLITLCEMLLSDSAAPLPIFVDAPTWASSRKDLLEYIANYPTFKNTGLSAEVLSRLNESGKLLIVINGWNEIGVDIQADARERLQQYLAGSAMPRLIVATRSASDSLGIPKPEKVTVRGFTWEDQQAFIRQSLPRDSARALLTSLRANAKLRAVTKNPLILTGAIALHKNGQVIPDSLFFLLESIIKEFENKDKRAVTLKGAPLRDCHRAYLEAISEAMNKSASVLIQETEARCIVTKTSYLLEEQGLLSARPDTSDVLEVLCGHHLLHRTDDSTLQFAHQRFQEFFSACVVLTRLNSALASDEERTAFKTEILNHPFWEDAVELVASRLTVDKSSKAKAELLIELALPVDLAYAAQLAGILGLEKDSCGTWQMLQDAIEMMHQQTAPEAQEYALHCAAATRSPEFAHLLWPLLENTDDEIKYNGFRLAEGLTVQQLGPDAIERMAQWSDDLRRESVWELAHRPKNLDFIKYLAYTDSKTAVRTAAIGVLDFYFAASDTALDAWWKAPDAVKEEESALSLMLEYWRPDDVAFTKELLEIARRSANESVKRMVGLRLLGHAEEIGVEVARHAMREQHDEHYPNTELVPFLKAVDPDFIKNLALERISGGKRLNNWMRVELASLSDKERDELVLSILKQMSTVEYDNFDASLAEFATEDLVGKLFEEGLQLVTVVWSERTADKGAQRRFRAIERLVTCATESYLMQTVLRRIDSCNYDEAAWIAEVLNRRAGSDDCDRGDEEERTQWRPATTDLDTFIEAVKAKTDPRDIPSCELEANLASLASKSGPERHLEYILNCTKHHMRAFCAYEEARKHWLLQPRQSAQPNSPYNGRKLIDALCRCGFDAVPGLFAMTDEPGASYVVPEALVAIISDPWLQRREKQTFPHDSYAKDHNNRRLLGRVFQQPDGTHQTVTDEVAQHLIRQIVSMTTAGEAFYVSDVLKPSMQAHVYWETCKLLSRVPSPLGLPKLRAILLREDAQIYPYLDLSQALISQGGMLPTRALDAISNLWQREMAKGWQDDQAQYRISKLAALHFFVEPVEDGLAQLKELLPEWLNKVRLWTVIDTVEKIPTQEAISILVDLLQQDDLQSEYEERILRAICTNPVPETANVLLQIIETGMFSKNSTKMYFLENSIIPRLKKAAVKDSDFMHRLLSVLENKTDTTHEALVCAVLGCIDDDKARMLVCRYLDEQAYPQGGKSAVRTLMGLFRVEVPIEPGSNCYEVHPQANQNLRRPLFTLALQQGPSQNRARALLLAIEQNRMGLGRPYDESRHPAIETGNPWPICLFDK